MNFNRGKMAAAAVLAATLLVVGGVTGYGLHRAGTVGQPFVDDGRLKVMASFYPMYDFARKVGGDRIQVKDMVPAGTEPHDWEPAAMDIRNLEDADVFVYNGADLEHWAEDVLDTLENQDLVVSEASDGVELLDGGHDHAHGDGHARVRDRIRGVHAPAVPLPVPFPGCVHGPSLPGSYPRTAGPMEL